MMLISSCWVVAEALAANLETGDARSDLDPQLPRE